jgi:hypothetical protein
MCQILKSFLTKQDPVKISLKFMISTSVCEGKQSNGIVPSLVYLGLVEITQTGATKRLIIMGMGNLGQIM